MNKNLKSINEGDIEGGGMRVEGRGTGTLWVVTQSPRPWEIEETHDGLRVSDNDTCGRLRSLGGSVSAPAAPGDAGRMSSDCPVVAGNSASGAQRIFFGTG